jgi:hypothetical protein
MNGTDLIGLLGREFGESVLQGALAELGFQTKRPRIPRGDSYVGIESRKRGVDMNFTRTEDLREPRFANLAEGSLILTAVFMYREGVEDHRGFELGLPHAIEFAFSRDDLRRALGAPVWSSPVLPIDRWEFESHLLIVDFAEDGRQIDTVTIQLPSR